MVNRRNLLKLSALGTASFAAPLAYSASKITMAYNTGNPPGSASPKDLFDNAEDLDYLMTGSGVSHPNRLGVSLKSWKGMEVEHNSAQARRESEFDVDQARRGEQFNAFMDASGYEPPVPYGAGILLDRTTKTVTYLGNEYRARGSFIPLTTSNWSSDESKLKLIGDDSLRQESANFTDPLKGAALIGRATRQINTMAELMVVPGRYHGDRIHLTAYRDGWASLANPGYVGEGGFKWSATSTTTANPGTVIAVTGVPVGRWLREVPNGELLGEMFGAYWDGITDSWAAIQAMLDEGTASKRNTGLTGRTFVITQSLVLRTFSVTMAGSYQFQGVVDFQGRNANTTRLRYPAISNAPALIVENIVGQHYSPLKGEIGSRMTFEGSATSWGIEYRGVGQLNTSGTIFSTNRYGQVFHNKDAGQYTEFVTSRDCRYTRYCLTKWRMMKTNGDDSMHGHSWESCTWEQDPGQPAFVVENNCIWYHARLKGTYFSNGETTMFLNNNSNVRYVADCHLELSYEASTNHRAILCDAPFINRGLYFTGNIRSLQKPVILKKAYQITALHRDPLSTTLNNPTFAPRSFEIKPSVDGYMDMTDLVAEIARWGGCIMEVMYSSTNNIGNHFYSDVLAIGPSGNFNPEAGSPTLVARLLAKNNANHGPAAYSYIGTSYQVRMTNANFTIANGSRASVTLTPIGNTWGLTPDNNMING
ncbi:hypothetical protein Q8X48_13225 [Pseudomonas sp. QLc11A]|uniref:Uncharacterized protein n=1 Tax=Pseudomonas azerbaijanorientalis TaxID=2842350 RepID=A0ABW8W2J7_9PSED